MKKETLDDIYRVAERESNEEGREAHVAELLRCYTKYRPENGKAWMLYGDALRVLGRKDDSFSALKRAFEMAPQEHRGYVAVRLAMLVEKHVSPLEAKGWYEIATDGIGTDAGWLWILRGANLSVLGEFREAIACFEAVVAMRANEKDEALLNLGLVYRAMGKYDEAVDWFRQALRIRPNYQEARDALVGLEGMSRTLDLLKPINGVNLH